MFREFFLLSNSSKHYFPRTSYYYKWLHFVTYFNGKHYLIRFVCTDSPTAFKQENLQNKSFNIFCMYDICTRRNILLRLTYTRTYKNTHTYIHTRHTYVDSFRQKQWKNIYKKFDKYFLDIRGEHVEEQFTQLKFSTIHNNKDNQIFTLIAS